MSTKILSGKEMWTRMTQFWSTNSKIALILGGMLLSVTLPGQNQPKTWLFIGTYTDGQPAPGIYVYAFDTASGTLTKTGTGENITNPSFLSIAPNGHFLYACTETKLPRPGSVSAFSIDSTNGSIRFLNKQSAGGENSVYLSVYKDNNFVVTGNYTAGNMAVFKVNNDGGLYPAAQILPFTGSSVDKKRQDKPHIHAAVFSPNYDYVYAPDLGSDKIRIFKFDPTRAAPLIPVDSLRAIPGSGPRHFTFHPNGKYAYCTEELSGMVSAYRYHNGQLKAFQRIFSYSKTLEVYNTADIHISPDGLFLYASNRLDEENTLSIFKIHRKTGKLKLVGHQYTFGSHPRNFAIDPTGNYLLVANMLTNNVVVFRRNLKTGLLTKTGTEISVPSPSCLVLRTYK